MKTSWVVFLISGVIVLSARGDSFLTPQQFPKTIDDLSFKSRMELLEDDILLDWGEYDENGICIKGCAYPGLNIKEEEKLLNEISEQSLKESLEYLKKTQNENNASGNTTTQNTTNNTITTNNNMSPPGNYTCENRNTEIPVNQKVPVSEPLKGKPYITSPYGPRNLYGRTFHAGIDYRAVVGTPVYSPADGTVQAIVKNGICGNGLRVKHEDGTTSMYCHLSKILVSQNQIVGAGCQIALTGNTGQSTGPHLHYGIKDKNGTTINPGIYTKRGR